MIRPEGLAGSIAAITGAASGNASLSAMSSGIGYLPVAQFEMVGSDRHNSADAARCVKPRRRNLVQNSSLVMSTPVFVKAGLLKLACFVKAGSRLLKRAILRCHVLIVTLDDLHRRMRQPGNRGVQRDSDVGVSGGFPSLYVNVVANLA